VSADDKLAHAPRLSIVVLPFANLSGDPEQDYFAEGLTDDLTTDLSHLADSFVIGRATAAAYKDKPVDLKQIGRDFGVRYALEGSVRRVGETITINAQLISTETGAHVWADRFGGERSRLGELQVEAVARIANALGVQLVNSEALRAAGERAADPDATDLVMRGWAAFNAGFAPDNLKSAAAFFEKALNLDPNDRRALEGKATTQMLELQAFGIGGEHPREVLDGAGAAIDRVLAAQPDNAHAHLTKGALAKMRSVLTKTTEPLDIWLAEMDAAIAADRNLAPAYSEKGHYMIASGRASEAPALIERAIRLDPHDPGASIRQWQMCDAYAHLAQWEQAIDWCQKSAASNPALFWPYFELAASYTWLGRAEDAARAVAELRKRNPDATVELYRFLQDFPNPRFVYERDRIMEGLRKAGLPEGQ
jgi:TolB-like protein